LTTRISLEQRKLEGRSVMMNEAKWEELRQDEEMAYFRADLCLSSPESYSLEEKLDAL
jgi:hypothetical protein